MPNNWLSKYKKSPLLSPIISDSVHKTQRRLRLRFGAGSTTELEKLIAAI